uniref:ATP-dependent DNA helicase n=1 Tax=Plectus sambesii TaxID=2011161 RepID=A0A914VBN9_9BILA
MLDAYFKLNRDDANARTLLYQDVPRHYVMQGGRWVPRRRGGATTIGWMCMVGPKDEGRYFLRVLLAHVPGAQSDEELRTVEGQVCATHREAALLRGLLEDNMEWAACLSEAARLQMPAQLRQLFVTILVFSEPSDPRALWEARKTDLCEDFTRHMDAEAAENTALRAIEAGLTEHGMSCKACGLPEPSAGVAEAEEMQQESDEQLGEDMRQRLNTEQRTAVDQVLAAVNGGPESQRCFFLDGPGGTGKTFVYNTLVHLVRGRGGHVLTVASTGIAATLLIGGHTAHSCFKIPIPVHNDSVCCVQADSQEADELRQATLIIWDEATMAHAYSMQAVDRLLRDLTRTNALFGGKVVVLGGDFRQTLPVVRCATRGGIVGACLKSSTLWPHFQVLQLVQNMRAGAKEQAFAAWLLELGNRQLLQSVDGLIELPIGCLEQGNLIYSVFERALCSKEPLSGCAILSPKNVESLVVNEAILALLPGANKTYASVDSVICDSKEEQNNYPLEFLHSLTPTGMLPHSLNLKIGAVVMLLRNLDTRQGLCNGTRLCVQSMQDHVVEAEVLLGKYAGRRVLIPKIALTPSDTDLPFMLRRRQLPLRTSFAMIINKAQGQTFERVGVYLPEPVFTHSQLYVAFSRVCSLDRIKVKLQAGATRTANVVYSEVL